MTFEWDRQKPSSNWRKHRVTFEEAVGVFLDPFATTYPDPDHGPAEDREISIGCTMAGVRRALSTERTITSDQRAVGNQGRAETV